MARNVPQNYRLFTGVFMNISLLYGILVYLGFVRASGFYAYFHVDIEDFMSIGDLLVFFLPSTRLFLEVLLAYVTCTWVFYLFKLSGREPIWGVLPWPYIPASFRLAARFSRHARWARSIEVILKVLLLHLLLLAAFGLLFFLGGERAKEVWKWDTLGYVILCLFATWIFYSFVRSRISPVSRWPGVLYFSVWLLVLTTFIFRRDGREEAHRIEAQNDWQYTRLITRTDTLTQEDSLTYVGRLGTSLFLISEADAHTVIIPMEEIVRIDVGIPKLPAKDNFFLR